MTRSIKNSIRITLLGILTLILPLSSFAAGKADSSILSIEYCAVNAYNLDTNQTGPGYYFGMNFTVANNIEVGFININGDGANCRDYNLFRINFFFKKRMGMAFMTGASSSKLASGFGIFYNIFQRNRHSLSTVLQLKIEYLYTKDLNENGTLLFGIAAKLGI